MEQNSNRSTLSRLQESKNIVDIRYQLGFVAFTKRCLCRQRATLSVVIHSELA